MVVHGRGVLICGASGSGKSALALQLIALGAQLVADDRTILTRNGSALMAGAPPTIAGMIEARGVGIVHLPAAQEARIVLCIDMDRPVTTRLPEPQTMRLLDFTLPCLHKVDAPYFPAAIHAYLQAAKL